MNWADFYLLCFAVGTLWTLAVVLLGGLHSGGHTHGAHGHASHAPVSHGHASHGHAGHSPAPPKGAGHGEGAHWLHSLINPSCAAVFLAWFGGVGYLLMRHSGLGLAFELVIAGAVGLSGAWILARFLQFLERHEKPLDPAEYEMVGVLGRVTSTVRADGVGEMVYVRDGARQSAAAKSEDGTVIGRGEEVIVTRYEKGFAYVRTWEAMTQRTPVSARPDALPKESENVE